MAVGSKVASYLHTPELRLVEKNHPLHRAVGDVRCTGHIQDSFIEGKEMEGGGHCVLDGLNVKCP